jgi:penicillin G amidase
MITRDDAARAVIQVDNERDAYMSLGRAMASDRLRQMDFLRREASGMVAEIAGAAWIDADRKARELGLRRRVDAMLGRLSDDSRDLLISFARGVNAVLAHRRENDHEIATLGYELEDWKPSDSMLVVANFAWKLSGFEDLLRIGETECRGSDARLDRQMIGEASSEATLGASGGSDGPIPVATGSNSWVISGALTRSGFPMVAADPHLGLTWPSPWYEARLEVDGALLVAGAFLAGSPLPFYGRGAHVAWAFTYNPMLQRDFYRGQVTRPAGGGMTHGTRGLVEEGTEMLTVRDASPVTVDWCDTDKGAVLSDLTAKFAREGEYIVVAWTGYEMGAELDCLRAMQVSLCAEDVRTALDPWCSPSSNFVFADEQGGIGYQSAGRVPRRPRPNSFGVAEAGVDDWSEVATTRDLPSGTGSHHAFYVSANNRPTSEPIEGLHWFGNSGFRAQRLRELLESRHRWDVPATAAIQCDVHSVRARLAMPSMIRVLADLPDASLYRAAACTLAEWDLDMSLNSAGALIFEAFFVRWERNVCNVYAGTDDVDHLAGPFLGRALEELVRRDSARSDVKIREVFMTTIDELVVEIGGEIERWKWSSQHTASLVDPLGDYTVGPFAVPGGNSIVNHFCNSSFAAGLTATHGPTYRIVIDLGDSTRMWSANSTPQSERPISNERVPPSDWLAGRLATFSLAGRVGGAR